MLTGSLVFLITLLVLCIVAGLWRRDLGPTRARYGRRRLAEPPSRFPRTPPKPPWVGREILKLKALMPEAGCRMLAQVFNRRHGPRGMTVGKTYVHDLIRKRQYEIRVLRRQLRCKPPKPVPRNRIWGLDLTGKRDRDGRTHTLLGVVEHHSRACLALQPLPDKCSRTLLRAVLDLSERFGKPRIVRTDNESVFTSRLFRFGLWLLGIRQERTDPACPWQNGRIERFFGTLKKNLEQWEVGSGEELERALHLFRLWYNHIRPHSALQGQTPAEVWAGTPVHPAHRRAPLWFEAWDGLLVGDYWPSG